MMIRSNIIDGRNKRLSLDTSSVYDDDCLTIDKIGNIFSFQGRQEESYQLYKCICDQDETRQCAQQSIEQSLSRKATHWDDFKRFQLPVTMGIAGIGKSELNRKGVSQYIQSLSQAYVNAASPREQQFITTINDNKCFHIRLGKMSYCIKHIFITSSLTILV
jgi:hypothetical protein